MSGFIILMFYFNHLYIKAVNTLSWANLIMQFLSSVKRKGIIVSGFIILMFYSNHLYIKAVNTLSWANLIMQFLSLVERVGL